MRILLIAVSVFVLINVFYVCFFFDIDKINLWEIRFYIWYGVLSMVVTCFGVLRIYNAVVTNSGYLLRLRQGLKTFTTSANDFYRGVNTHTKQLASLKGVLKNLADKISHKK